MSSDDYPIRLEGESPFVTDNVRGINYADLQRAIGDSDSLRGRNFDHVYIDDVAPVGINGSPIMSAAGTVSRWEGEPPQPLNIHFNSIREAMEHQGAERRYMFAITGMPSMWNVPEMTLSSDSLRSISDNLTENAGVAPEWFGDVPFVPRQFTREYLANFVPENFLEEINENIGEVMQENISPVDLSSISPIPNNTFNTISSLVAENRAGITRLERDIISYRNSLADKQSDLIRFKHEKENLDRLLNSYVPSNNWKEKFRGMLSQIDEVCRAFNLYNAGSYIADQRYYKVSLLRSTSVVDGMLIPPLHIVLTINMDTTKPYSIKFYRIVREQQGNAHPHIDSNAGGSVCLGNGQALIDREVNIFDYIAIHLAAISQYNPESPYSIRQITNLNNLVSSSTYARAIRGFIKDVYPNFTDFHDLDACVDILIKDGITNINETTRRANFYYTTSNMITRFRDSFLDKQSHYRIISGNGSRIIVDEITHSALMNVSNIANMDTNFPKILTLNHIDDLKSMGGGRLEYFVGNLEFYKYRLGIDANDNSWYDVENIFNYNKKFIADTLTKITRLIIGHIHVANVFYSDGVIQEMISDIKDYDIDKLEEFVSEDSLESDDLSCMFDDITSSYSDYLREFEKQEPSNFVIPQTPIVQF